MELILQTVINSIMISVFYALIAVGLALVFGVMGILNFAHGEFYMAGAYGVWIVYSECGAPFGLGLIAAMVIVACLALFIQQFLFRPMIEKPMMGLVISIGVLFILQVAVGQIWGVGLWRQVMPALRGSLEIFGASAPWQRIIVIPGAALLLGGLWYFLHRMKAGQALRAAAQDRDAAALQGISINKAGLLAMGIGGILAGAAGGFMAPIMQVTPYMGHSIILIAFAVIIVGGVGSIEGALIASFIYGFLHTFVTTYVDGTAAAIAGVLLLFFVLLVRPGGIMAHGQT